MSIKLITPPRSVNLAMCIAGVLLAVLLGWTWARAYFVDTLATRLDYDQPGVGEALDWLTQAGASDPNAHLLAAVYYDRTFEMSDVTRSLREYETATELAPNHYLFWLNLARARSRAGDDVGAEVAFKRALDLAPNYQQVQWAYGNFLVRQGREQEGFPLISKAAAANPELAATGVSILLQMNGGDTNRARELLGDDPAVSIALANWLAAMKRYEDAFSFWNSIPVETRRENFRDMGQSLIRTLMDGGSYRAAASIASDLADPDAPKPAVGTVMNGGFENGVKLRSAGPFEWQIEDKPEPQVGLSRSLVHSGQYALTMSFETFRPEAFRGLSQLIPVEPGRTYRLDLWAKSTLKSPAQFKWQVGDPVKHAPLATTGAITPGSDWVQMSATFTVPPNSDGVAIGFIREGCLASACQMSGTIAFDDIALTKLQ